MRGFVGVRGDDQKWTGGQPGLEPTPAHGGLVDFQAVEVMLPEALSGRAAGTEGFYCFLRGKTTEVGVLESILRHAGNVAPGSGVLICSALAAEKPVSPIVPKVKRVQAEQKVVPPGATFAVDQIQRLGTVSGERVLHRFTHPAIPALPENHIFSSRDPHNETHFGPMRLGAVMLCLLVLAVSPVRGAGEPAQAGTARDVISRADDAYNDKRYSEAAEGYRKFLEDFGASSEAAPLLPRVSYNLSAALMHLQKYEDAREAIDEARKLPEMGAEQEDDLAFWAGLALLQGGNPAEASKALEQFRHDFPRSSWSPDAELLHAAALLADGKHAEAAAIFGTIRKSTEHPHSGRGAVLELHCLIEAGREDEALMLLGEEGPTMAARINQIATFQTLALRLGEKLLEDNRPRDAIRALQNVWPHERLISLQRRKLDEMKEQLAALDRKPGEDIFARAHQKQQLREIEKELVNLEKIQSFDASVRFRMATAFHRQQRYRECALLLDDMLRQMKPDTLVEKASLSALQSWMAIEGWDRAVAASRMFEQSFPSSKSLPLVLYLRGTAQQKAGEYDAAIGTFSLLRERFADSDQAARALFMIGFTQLLAERNEDAAGTFRRFGETCPDHELAEAADYWRGSALAFAKKFPEAREVLAAHAAKFPGGSLRGPAAFRLAYCAQSLKDYETAERELKDYLRNFPDGEENAEARLLLGDALLATAQSEEGKAIYASVEPDSGRFHEDAQFKLAKVLKLEDDQEGLRRLMLSYTEAYPRSPRVAEALFLIGQSWRSQGQPEKAIEAYWSAISDRGNDARAVAVEDMLLALNRHYKGEPEKREFQARLREMRDEALAVGKKVLAVRCIWALARSVKKTDPALSGALLREAGAMAQASETSSAILSDCAEAQLAAADTGGSPDESAVRRAKSAQLYRDLLKWHPRAVQKDEALAALARMASRAGDTAAALQYYDRIERDTPWSPLMGEVLSARAGMELEAGNTDKAVKTYTRLLAAENVPSKLKARTLLALGEIEMERQRPQTAIPYYQRIYVLYGKWRDAVAEAYLRSGEAFEQLNDAEAARKTYQELAGRDDLASLPQVETARKRLEKLTPSDQSS